MPCVSRATVGATGTRAPRGKRPRGGHLSVLDYLLACGCSIGPDAATAAAEGGHLEVLKRLERVPVGSDGRDVRWDWGTCAAAAANERWSVSSIC